MKKIFPILFATLVLFSCEDDFNINGEWQNIPIVYSLINPSDTAHYIRVNKAFLGNQNANEMAQISDSINYSSNISVKLIEYKLLSQNGSTANPFEENSWEVVDTAICYPTNEVEKQKVSKNNENGNFATDNHILYKTKKDLEPERKYRLEIEIPGKPEKVWSDAYTLGNSIPKSFFHPTDPAIQLENEKHPYCFEWKSSNYGKIYQLYISFHYYDIINNDTTLQSVKISYPTQSTNRVKTPKDPTGVDLKQEIGGVRFFRSLAAVIPNINGVKRVFNNLDIVIVSGGNNFYNYLNISETTMGYGQSAPQFSNIKNGIGLFDARSTNVIEGIRFNYNSTSLDSLANGRYTKKLGFSILDTHGDPGF